MFEIMHDLFLEVSCLILYIVGIVEVKEIEEAIFGNRSSNESVFDHLVDQSGWNNFDHRISESFFLSGQRRNQ